MAFKRSHCGAIGAAALVLALAASPIHADDVEQYSGHVYSFDGHRLPSEEGIVHARIVYTVADRIVHSENVSFSRALAAEAEFPLLDLVLLGAAHGAPDRVRVDVYVADRRIDSFDPVSLEDYGRRLRARELRQSRSTAGRDVTRPHGSGSDLRAITAQFSACETSCRQAYFSCVQSCPDQQCQSYCNADHYDCRLGCPEADSDGDGTDNGSDNCLETYNPSQANCDGDSFGDACDSLNAIYVVDVPKSTCMTDEDDHVVYKTYEHHAERRETDVSNCGAPDQWIREKLEDNDCWNLDDRTCCEGLEDSIESLGDSTDYWCIYNRNVDDCHVPE